MIRSRDVERNLARTPVEILFYLASEKDGKRLLKPLSFKGSLNLAVIRAILENTIASNFYDTLSKDLLNKGVAPGSTVQLRAKFSTAHSLYDTQLTGTKIVCEIKI
ncbi:hypothetical protein HY990_04765 [Candidatus Micrarchaeota archaeon]|nr:hypothetical protein [Candidatus Micrarchaeota archaeon]